VREERLRAGAGDGPEGLDQVLTVHADAVVDDGEGACVAIDDDADPQIPVALRQLRVSQRRIADTVASIRRV
jgi:hypothetical protein